VPADATFDEFLTFTIDKVFGAMLDQDLERARVLIRSVLRPNAEGMLQKLADDVYRILPAGSDMELVDAIRAANTELQNALDRVTAWFYRTDTVMDEPFTINEAILISAETVRAVSPQFSVEGPGQDADWAQARGQLLNPFVDVFILIFQNIVRHAGLESPSAVVSLSPSADRTSISITVTNQVSPEAATPEAKARVLKIKADMEGADHVKFISREGGTGFHKLKKILTHDIEPNAVVDFGFVEGDRFLVEFRLRTTEVPFADEDLAS
jgi:hypothetical protein